MIGQNLLMAIKSILGNKMRAGLTVLGIVIGIASVISMLAVGTGAQQSISANIQSMGTNLLFIHPGSRKSGLVKSSSTVELNLDEMDTLLEEVTVPVQMSAEASGRGQIKYKNLNTNTTLTGVNACYFDIRNYDLDQGTLFSSAQDRTSDRICVLGNTVVEKLFTNGEDPIGQTIRINRLPFKVIGTYKEKGSSGWKNEDDQIMIPIRTMQKRITGSDDLRAIVVSVTDKDDTATAQSDIETVLRRLHRIGENDADDFEIRSQNELLETMDSVSQSFTILLGSIALISLVVGGIGIMNILLVSVSERTKEIGIRKAIGAYESDILNQFLIEALVLCTVGGLIGIVIGVAIASGISFFSEWNAVVTIHSVLISLVVSFAVGVIFGYFPARKAARMNPIEALRYE